MDFPFEGESLRSFWPNRKSFVCLGRIIQDAGSSPNEIKLDLCLRSGILSPGSLSRLELIADTYLSVNTPIQNALPKVLALSGTIQSSFNPISQNRNLIFDFLQGCRKSIISRLRVDGLLSFEFPGDSMKISSP